MSWLHLLHWWWSGDRVRVSPREGRLLRLRPGYLLRIAGASVEVVQRREVAGSNPGIICRCRGVDGEGELEVDLSGRVRWLFGGQEMPLTEDDVEIFRGNLGFPSPAANH